MDPRNAPPEFGITNSLELQSMQIQRFGNAKAGGLFRFFSPGEWMTISTENRCWFSEPHELHAITFTSPDVKQFRSCCPEATKDADLDRRRGTAYFVSDSSPPHCRSAPVEKNEIRSQVKKQLNGLLT